MKTHHQGIRLIFGLLIALFYLNSSIHAQTKAGLANVDEDCIPPELFTDFGFDNVICFNFDLDNPFNPIWLEYDDGVNVDGIGVADEFTMACRWSSSQLFGLEDTYITKIRFFPLEANSTFTLKIWFGEDGNQLIYSQPVDNIVYNQWNEIALNEAIGIIPDEGLYVGFEIQTDGETAGAGNYTGNPNSNLIRYNGSDWMHLSDLDLPLSWNLGVYVEQVKSGDGAKELIGFNLYKNYVLVNDEPIQDSTYCDTIGYGYFTYYATAVYSICGESAPSGAIYISNIMIGIDNDLKKNIQVYPTVVSDYIHIEANSPIKSVHVFNISGNNCLKYFDVAETVFEANLSSLENGTYLIEIKTESDTQRFKVLVLH